MKMYVWLIMAFGLSNLQPLSAQDALLPEVDAVEEIQGEEEEMSDAEKALRDSIRARGEELVSLLKKVQDAATAKKYAARIRALLLWEPDAALMEQADEELLAVEFMESFDAIATELSRLAYEKFYGEESLQELLPYFETELEEETP